MSTKKSYECPKLPIQLDSSIIAIQESVKYLRILIDNKMNFREHMNSLETVFSRSVALLSKLKHIMPKQTLTNLYYALIHSHLTYGITVWSATYKYI